MNWNKVLIIAGVGVVSLVTLGICIHNANKRKNSQGEDIEDEEIDDLDPESSIELPDIDEVSEEFDIDIDGLKEDFNQAVENGVIKRTDLVDNLPLELALLSSYNKSWDKSERERCMEMTDELNRLAKVIHLSQFYNKDTDTRYLKLSFKVPDSCLEYNGGNDTRPIVDFIDSCIGNQTVGKIYSFLRDDLSIKLTQDVVVYYKHLNIEYEDLVPGKKYSEDDYIVSDLRVSKEILGSYFEGNRAKYSGILKFVDISRKMIDKKYGTLNSAERRLFDKFTKCKAGGKVPENPGWDSKLDTTISYVDVLATLTIPIESENCPFGITVLESLSLIGYILELYDPRGYRMTEEFELVPNKLTGNKWYSFEKVVFHSPTRLSDEGDSRKYTCMSRFYNKLNEEGDWNLVSPMKVYEYGDIEVNY